MPTWQKATHSSFAMLNQGLHVSNAACNIVMNGEAQLLFS
jgi:hypothetical protein